MESGIFFDQIREAIEEFNVQMSDILNQAASSGLGAAINDESLSDITVYSSKKINEKFNEIMVNIKDFGAKCDGITDDTAAIQAAIDFLSTSEYASQGIVYMPMGTIIINGNNTPVRLRRNIKLMGAGMGRTIIKPQLGNTASRMFEDRDALINVEICDFTIDFTNRSMIAFSFGDNDTRYIALKRVEFKNRPVTPGTYSHTIVFSETTSSEVAGCRFINMNTDTNIELYSTCITVRGHARNIKIHNNYFENIKGTCISISEVNGGCYDIEITNNTSVRHGYFFINVYEVTGIKISDNIICQNLVAASLPPPVESFLGTYQGSINVHFSSYIVVTNNYIRDAGQIGIYDCYNFIISNNMNINPAHGGLEINSNNHFTGGGETESDGRFGIVSNNYFEGSKFYGGLYVSGSDIVVSNNISCRNYKNGLSACAPAYRVKFVNNICYDNNLAGKNNAGIYIANDDDPFDTVVDVELDGNICFDTQEVKTQKYGIWIGKCIKNVIIKNNNCFNNIDEPVHYSYGVGYKCTEYGNSWNGRILYRSAVPTAETWRLGDVVYNTKPIPGGYIGWICTKAGIACGTVWTANTPYIVDAIRYTSNRVYKCTIAGVSGTAAPTHTTGTVADGTVTWEYLGEIAEFKVFGLIQP